MSGIATRAGLKIAETINAKRMNSFIDTELKKLNLNENEEYHLFNIVRFDNFFFQKRFIFVISGDKIFIKQQLRKNDEWLEFDLNSINCTRITPKFRDKVAVENCGELVILNDSLNNPVFKGGKRFFVEKHLGQAKTSYDEELNPVFFDLLTRKIS